MMKRIKRVFVNPIYKDKATVLENVEETGGSYMVGELEIAPTAPLKKPLRQ